jgi:hypothetical protein
MKKFYLGMLVVGLCGQRMAGASININVEAVQKSVVFLYGAQANGGIDSSKPLGTGFIVEVPLRTNPQKAYKLLVTARHIVEPQWALCPAENPQMIFVRFNKKNYDPSKDATGILDAPLQLIQDGARLYHTHSDESVDVAVIVLIGNLLEDYDIVGIPIWLFPTQDELKAFAPSDSIVSAGLVPGASGKKRNYPLFKFGYISSIPDELVESSCAPNLPTHLERLWFIAANLVPGNSGSPILFVPSGFGGLSIGGQRPMLLGVQSTSFLLWDVAGMTPVQYLYEVVVNLGLPDSDLSRGARSKAPVGEKH